MWKNLPLTNMAKGEICVNDVFSREMQIYIKNTVRYLINAFAIILNFIISMTTSVQLQLVLLYKFRKLLFCLHGTKEVNSATFYIN